MTGESDNLPTGGTDTAHPLSLDDAENIDYFDPDEDNGEGDQDQQSEEVTDEADEGQEAEETDTAEEDDQAEGEDEGTADKADKPEPTDDVTVTVNGQPIALSELKAGYQRQSDYSRKTQEVANSRRDLEALTARVTTSVNAIADFLSKQIPEKPDISLLYTNPQAYHMQKEMHELANAQVQALLEQANAPKEVAAKLTADQRSELLQSENAKLAEVFPATATQEGRKKFFERAASAAKEAGYSEDDIGKVSDHRLFIMAHYAAIGLQAEKAKAKAQTKVANVPPVTPQRRPQSSNAAKVRQNKEAMKRLARTGSLDDAMSIDFD